MSQKRSKLITCLVHTHWLVVVLIILSYFFIETRGVFGKQSMYDGIAKISHFYIGFTILFLTIFSLIIRPYAKLSPVEPAIQSKPQRSVSKIVHGLLYVALIVMPLLGWFMLSAYGENIPFNIPQILPINHLLGSELEDIHKFIGNALLYLIFLHATGALFNHYVLKNNTLKRMTVKCRDD